ncbi:class C sortase [Lactobacillus johnsonii]|uniref:Class C sortase n=1 Tax=Lactobacillus johnsonii TaxID=33959 RepID=A0A9X7TD90_LACJH|nr:class C sortase [Lactobacillus johnsonii]QIA88522.1 class C sortase [Lactobacillus johnsonii]
MKKGNKFFGYAIWAILCLATLGASTYPFLQDYFLSKKQEAQVAKYEQYGNKYLDALYKAPKHDQQVADPFAKSPKKKQTNSVDVAEAELKPIAVLSIPKIKEVLPVYMGTSQTALENGVGLLENTSLPTGGKGKHSVLTGHSGLSLNRLFTDLDKLKKGDKFYLKVNKQIHAYQVDQIKKVLPDNLSYFQTDPNKDYVTLVTCTPIFQNTHRLLVRGHRVPYNSEKVDEDGGLTSLGKAVIVAAVVSTGMGLVYWYFHKKPKKGKGREQNENQQK